MEPIWYTHLHIKMLHPPPSTTTTTGHRSQKNGARREHCDLINHPNCSSADRHCPTEPNTGVPDNAATAANDSAIGNELLLHWAPEIPLRSPTMGHRQSPIQVHTWRRTSQPLGRLPIQSQDPRRHRHLPLPFLPRSKWLMFFLTCVCVP